MNGQPTVNQSTNNNEQLIGKFHVVNVDKLPINPVGNHDDITIVAGQQQQHQQQQPPPASATDESGCASRFQMIRVDRNFGRGRWKVNDYEPPENISTSTNPPVNNIENEIVNISHSSTLSAIPTASTTTVTTIPPNASLIQTGDSNATSSATLAATAASAAAAAATAFQQQQQQQQQQRLIMNNSAAANVPPPANLLHAYPPAALANMAASNQSYLLANHPQFGYYPFFPPPYSHYAAQWAALAAANPYLPPPPLPPHQQQTSQLQTGNLGEPIRHADTVPDLTSENLMISSIPFPNPATDHLQNAQLAATAASPFIYATHPPHSTYVSQALPASASPYATIASYHPSAQPPTIIPPPTQPSSLAQVFPTNTTDIQQQLQQQLQQQFQQHLQQQHSYQPQPSQQAPILTSPKHDASSTKNPAQQSIVPKTAPTNPTKPPTTTTAANGVNTDTLKITTATTNPTQITDLLSSSPSITNSQLPPSLLSPITVQTTNPNNIPSPNKATAASLNDIWSLTATGSPLNLSQAAAQTAAVTAVAAMGLLNNETGKNTEIASEILKELTTPTKQNNTTDIDNKISAAMDLVKMHLLSAVREEVTELRQQIRTLNEKVTNVEHENAFLRQHVPSEIYAQYTPIPVGSTTANDSTNPTTIVTTTASSTIPSSSIITSQSIPMASLPSLPSSLPQQLSSSTILQQQQQPPPSASSINLPST